MKECRLYQIYDRLMSPLEDAFLREQRVKLCSSISGDILEIGGGTGANVPYLQNGDRVTLSEPNWDMCQQLKSKSSQAVHSVLLCPSESLPLASESFDVVVSTLVLCTVSDPEKTLNEISRILRPGGVLVFLEHIRAEGIRSVFQDLLQPLWSLVSCGCHSNRKTIESISKAGLKIQEFQLLNPSGRISQPARSLIQLTLPFVRGIASKTS